MGGVRVCRWLLGYTGWCQRVCRWLLGCSEWCQRVCRWLLGCTGWCQSLYVVARVYWVVSEFVGGC